MESTKLRIVVLGYLVRGPLGGLAWHHLQYVVGLKELGHDVYFVEDSDEYESCYDPSKDSMGKDPTYGLGFASRAFERVGLDGRWAYYDAHTLQWLGPCRSRITEIGSSADMLLNISGVNPVRSWFTHIPARVLVDTDPVFTQIRHLTTPAAKALAHAHNSFFSFGENFGHPGCGIPNDGFPWQPTRQPIVLGTWQVTPGPNAARFTTVMQWDSYPPREYAGRKYGMKSDSFSPYMDLPSKVGQIFELAVGSRSVPRELLRTNGWNVVDPREATLDPWKYQDYIQHSKGEFGVAKHGYVVASSGWFSERSAAYLASGRPVITQNTGFTDWLRSRDGILAFTSPDEAVDAIRDVNERYQHHCSAARAVAEEYFDARTVLGSLIERAQKAA